MASFDGLFPLFSQSVPRLGLRFGSLRTTVWICLDDDDDDDDDDAAAASAAAAGAGGGGGGSVCSFSNASKSYFPGPRLLTGEDLNALSFPHGPMCIQSSPICLMSCLLANYGSSPSPLSPVPND